MSTAFVSSISFCGAMHDHPYDINRYTYSRNHIHEAMEEMHNEPALRGKIKLLDITKDHYVLRELFDAEIPGYNMKDFHDSDCTWKYTGLACSCTLTEILGGFIDTSKFVLGSCAGGYVKNVENLNEQEKNAYRDSLIKLLFTNCKRFFCWTLENDFTNLNDFDEDKSRASYDDNKLFMNFAKLGNCSHNNDDENTQLSPDNFDGHIYFVFIEPTGGEEKNKFLSFSDDKITVIINAAQRLIKKFNMDSVDTNEVEWIFFYGQRKYQ